MPSRGFPFSLCSAFSSSTTSLTLSSSLGGLRKLLQIVSEKNWVPISRKLKKLSHLLLHSKWKYLTIFLYNFLCFWGTDGRRWVDGGINEEIIKQQLVASPVCCYFVVVSLRSLPSSSLLSPMSEKGCEAINSPASLEERANNCFWSCDKDALRIIIFRIKWRLSTSDGGARDCRKI